MPGGPGGGPPGGMMMPGPPSQAAIFIKAGAESTSKEYRAGQYQAQIKSEANGITILGLNLNSGQYTYNGIAVTGAKSVVTLDKARMKLGVTQEAGAKEVGGAAVSVGDAKLIVNNSSITQTGSNRFTSQQTEPFSNDALFISGIARSNMSTGTSHTYYFNSTVTTEGWAALSTDASSGDGLDLYAYNTRAIAQHGGYGTYADFGCRVWLYGSTLESPEVGAIIARSGEITIADGASAPAEIMKFNLGETTAAGTVIAGGRDAVMIHAPDMMGEGKGAAAYIDYINGAALLIKSTSATISFDRAKLDSFSGVAVMTVLNSDRMGNFLKAETDGSQVKPVAITMKNMSVNADINHMDYQRIMTLSLERATLKGAVVSGMVEDWNKLWAVFQRKDTRWVQNDKWGTFYGVRMTLKQGSTWEVSGPSLLSSLTVENGATRKGRVQVDGATVRPTVGKTYTGKIAVTPL